MKTTQILKVATAIIVSSLIFILQSCTSGEEFRTVSTIFEGLIAKLDNTNMTATIVGYAVNDGKVRHNLSMFDSVIANGECYEITEFGERAFVGGSWEQVGIPQYVKVIGDEAFAECKNITVVSIYSSVLPVLGKEVFEDEVYEKATLIVDRNIDLSGTPWEYFVNIHRVDIIRSNK